MNNCIIIILKDFPSLPWFLPYCFGKAAPEESMIGRCKSVTAENVNQLVKEFPLPYTHLKAFKEQLNDESKAKIAVIEPKLDTVIWYVCTVLQFVKHT